LLCVGGGGGDSDHVPFFVSAVAETVEATAAAATEAMAVTLMAMPTMLMGETTKTDMACTSTGVSDAVTVVHPFPRWRTW
jgi:hypothetical protein